MARATRAIRAHKYNGNGWLCRDADHEVILFRGEVGRHCPPPKSGLMFVLFVVRIKGTFADKGYPNSSGKFGVAGGG